MELITFSNICLSGLLVLAGFIIYIIATGSRTLRNYLLTRLVLTIPTIWILVTLVFLMMRVIPGDPVSATLKPGAANKLDVQERIGIMEVDRTVITATSEDEVASYFDETGRLAGQDDFMIEESDDYQQCDSSPPSRSNAASNNSDEEPIIFCHVEASEVPILRQYFDYLGDLAGFDLGRSITVEADRPVGDIISDRLPATLELTIPSIIFMLIFGIFTGAFAAHHHRGKSDYSLRISSVFIYSIPVFWMGLMFQLIFASELGLLPVARRFSGRIPFEERTGFYLLDSLLDGDFSSSWIVIRHMILPTLTLGLALIGVFIRLTRSNMIEILQEDYITASRARGVPEKRVVYRHALRNSFIPIMTFIGLQVAVMLGGTILTETTFSWDGMGKLIRDGIALRDFTVVQGAVTVFAVIVGVISTLTDILYAFIDPRVRY